jgi:asparagine synthase (glutamine-hydrolysing)
MCGICGEVRFDGRPVTAGQVIGMRDRLIHRGPDSDGTYISPGGSAGLGFRRLRIIDLSANGSQPMGNEDGSIQVVFNGEIYNFQALRDRLEQRGHRFRSKSDTETIVHLYEDEGPAAIEQLDGMFAIAIWDERQRKLTLARDRAGKKPLFFHRTPRRILFASEIKALMVHPDFETEVDPAAVPYLFLYGYAPSPHTFYRGVDEVPPGSLLTLRHDGTTEVQRRYWTIGDQFLREPGPRRAVPRAEATARVRELMTDAVSRRLVSDVPLGAFLSGGVDSTIVVGIMSRLMREPVKTFSIGFEGDARYDETAYAREAAERFRTNHTEFRVTPSAMGLIDKLIWHHDGPFGDSSAIPTYIVSELTRRQVTVVLNGDGGDELFAGYLRFLGAVVSERIPRALGVAADAVLSRVPSPSRHKHWLSFAQRFSQALTLPLYDRITRWNSFFYGDDLGELLRADLYDAASIDPLAYLRGDLARLERVPTTLGKVLDVNFSTYLPGDLLVKMDRCAMANSLEARSPFLDTALIEYVTGLPDDYKLAGRRTKAILRDAFADLLPASIQTRGKMGFAVPLGAWFRGELREFMTDHLLDPGARYTAYLNAPLVHRIVERHLAGDVDASPKIWTILCFERWLRLLPEWAQATAETPVGTVAAPAPLH